MISDMNELPPAYYLPLGDGYFEPRLVETGSRLGDRVQITKGLEPGERIVVSGNFLLDSESRMKLTAVRAAAPTAEDPVCGMDVDAAKAAGKFEYQGKTWYFCSKSCQEKFAKNFEQYAAERGLAHRARNTSHE